MQKRSRVLSTKPFNHKDISNAKRAKRRAERKYQKSGLVEDKHQLNVAMRILKKTVQIRYDEFYSEKLGSVKGDSKATYKIIDHLLNKCKRKVLPSYSLPQSLADNFEHFFSTRIEQLRQGMQCIGKNIVTKNNSSVFENFSAVTNNELKAIIKSTKIRFSTIDNIPPKLITHVLNSSFEYILSIVNRSLITCIFPD